MPGNAILPEHNGMIIPRSLQEWACLLAQDMPFETVVRLLSWQTQTPSVLSSTEVRQLVRTHGQVVRQAEADEVQALLAQGDLAGLQPHLIPTEAARRSATWPAELNAAVETALAAETPQSPTGVSAGDWARMLTARRAEPTLSQRYWRYLSTAGVSVARALWGQFRPNYAAGRWRPLDSQLLRRAIGALTA